MRPYVVVEVRALGQVVPLEPETRAVLSPILREKGLSLVIEGGEDAPGFARENFSGW